MHRIKIKPLSVNEAWKGQRFKTDKYKSFETEMLWKLPKLGVLKPPYKLEITFGISIQSDLDNCLKQTIDCLQKKYGINDKDIMEIHAKKVVTKEHFIEFEIIGI